MSGAAEERRSRGSLEKSRHMLPSISPPAFALPRLFCPVPLVTSHMDKQIHIQVALLSLSFLTCFAPARALCALFPPSSLLSSPLLPLCLFMLLLLLLPDIFRDELQSTAGGKKSRGGAVWATCVPLASSSLSRGPLLFPHVSVSFILSIFVCVLLSFTSLSSLLSSQIYYLINQ